MAEVVDHKSTRSDAVLSPVVRLAHVWVHRLRTKNGLNKEVKPHRAITLLVPKLNASPDLCANYQWFHRHLYDACARQPGWNGIPQGSWLPIKDGDAPRTAKPAAPGMSAVPVDPEKYAYQKGCWIIEATNYSKNPLPVCVMQGSQAIEITAQKLAGKQMYKSGDYGQVFINAFTFHNEKWGAKFSFDGVCFTSEGELIGSSGMPPTAAAMFSGIAPVVSHVAPPPGGPLPQPALPGQVPAQAPGYAAPAPVAAPVYTAAPAPAPVYAAPQPGQAPSYAPPQPQPGPAMPSPPPVPGPAGPMPPFPGR